jgi:hypothetical protein
MKSPCTRVASFPDASPFAPLTTDDPYEATNPATHNKVRFVTSILGKLHAGLNKTSLPQGTMPAIAL